MTARAYWDSFMWHCLKSTTYSPGRKPREGHDLFLEYYPQDTNIPNKRLAWVMRSPKMHDEAIFNDNSERTFPRIGVTYELRGGRLRLIEDPVIGHAFKKQTLSERGLRGERLIQVFPGVNRFIGEGGWYRLRNL